MANPPQLIAYADGSCIRNPGPGGWGVVLVDTDGVISEFSGAARATTNNRMEITAVIEALRRVPAGTAVTVHSDSQYVVKTMTLGWKRRENLDLWQVLDAEVSRRRVSWEWLRGHTGDPLNERADELARSAALGRSSRAHSPSAGPPSSPLHLLRPASGSGRPPANELSGDGPHKEAEIAQALRPLLDQGESLQPCAGCGRLFVASSRQLDYCALAGCQLKARQGKD